MAVAQDQDTLTTFTYNIISGADSVFAVNAASGEITVIDSSYLDVETTPIFEITIQVADGGLFPELIDTATFIINLNDINEKPILAADTFLINENSLNNFSVGMAVAQDQDTLTTFTYNIISGADSVFAVNAASGEITVIDSSYLDVETTPIFEITIQVADGGLFPELTDTATFIINLNDLNEKPELAADTF